MRSLVAWLVLVASVQAQQTVEKCRLAPDGELHGLDEYAPPSAKDPRVLVGIHGGGPRLHQRATTICPTMTKRVLYLMALRYWVEIHAEWDALNDGRSVPEELASLESAKRC